MPKGKKNEEPQMIEMQDLSAAAKKVDMMFEYLGMKKGAGYQIGSNDIMDLRKVYSDYNKKLNNYYSMNAGELSKATGSNSYAQYADLRARVKDTEANLKKIDEAIINGISSNDTDYGNLYNKLNDSLSDEDRETEATQNLLTALVIYDGKKKGLVNNELNKKERESVVDARQKLLDCCLDYMKKKPMSDLNAFTVIDEITEAISKEGEKAFGQLNNEDFRKFNARSHVGFFSKNLGLVDVAYIGNAFHDDMAYIEKRDEIMKGHSNEDYDNPEVQGKIEAYYQDLYDHSRFGSGLKYNDLPWNKITFKEYTDSKEAFEKNQERNRNFFGETYGALVNGAFKKNIEKFWETAKTERETASGFLSTLNDNKYNGFGRSILNSPEYEAVLNSLKSFTKESKEDSMQSVGENRKAVVDACKAYIEHYDEKVRTNKGNSEFAKMRVDKVKELYASLGVVEAKKEVEKEKTSFNEISGENKVGKTAKVNSEAAKAKEKKGDEL